MLVATFGQTTGWAGKTITFDNGVFTLEGHGPVSASDVLTYDRQGHLAWAYDGLREWVEAQCQTVAPAAPLMGSAVRGAASPSKTNRQPLLIAAVVVAAVITIFLIFSAVHAANEYNGGSAEIDKAYHGLTGGDSYDAPIYSLNQFNQIQTGMTFEQVTAAIGSGGTKTAESNIAGISTEAYSYQNADGSNMQLMFQNGALIQKAQFGLQ